MTSIVGSYGNAAVRGPQLRMADFLVANSPCGSYRERATSQTGKFFQQQSGPVAAFSRLALGERILIVTNSSCHEFAAAYVMLDRASHKAGDHLHVLYSNHDYPVHPGYAVELPEGASLLLKPDGTTSTDPLLCCLVTLAPQEIQVLGR